MLKPFSIVSCLLIIFSLIITLSASAFDDEKEKQPIVITSRSLTADNKNNIATFEGSVVATSEDLTIYSDKMIVYSDPDGNGIKKLHAAGNVKVHKRETTLFADEALYFEDEEKIIFSGNPKAVQKGNVITGSEIIFYIKDERAIVQKSRVVLQNRKGLK
jgi:lipopolysaccharide export system protein LptA